MLSLFGRAFFVIFDNLRFDFWSFYIKMKANVI